MADPKRRAAFLATVRSVIGTGGQRVNAADRLYLAEHAHRSIPGSRFEVFEGIGHLPQLEARGRFIVVLEEFLAETEAARFDREEWKARFQAERAAS